MATTPTKTRKATAKTMTGEIEFKRCACGCTAIINPKRQYLSGHDARHLGALLKAFDGGDEEARVEILNKGWRSNDDLEARAEKREAKEKARTDREAAKTGK